MFVTRETLVIAAVLQFIRIVSSLMEARKRSRQALSAPMAEREEKSLTRDKTQLLGVCKKELHHLIYHWSCLLCV